MARPRKAGKRTKSGRLSRAYDKGIDNTALKFSIYGTDGSDAIGRAFVKGFIEQHHLDTGRAIARAYWPMLCVGRIGCTLGDRGGGGGDGNADRERWLTETLRSIDAKGRGVRDAFNDLVININPDSGPAWLDRMIAGQARKEDSDRMAVVIAVLDELAA